jgi:hypothetical protein
VTELYPPIFMRFLLSWLLFTCGSLWAADAIPDVLPVDKVWAGHQVGFALLLPISMWPITTPTAK